MANPFFGENSQQNKTGGSGAKLKKTGPASPSLNMKAGPSGQAPGVVKAATGGPKGVGRPAKIYANSKGV